MYQVVVHAVHWTKGVRQRRVCTACAVPVGADLVTHDLTKLNEVGNFEPKIEAADSQQLRYIRAACVHCRPFYVAPPFAEGFGLSPDSVWGHGVAPQHGTPTQQRHLLLNPQRTEPILEDRDRECSLKLDKIPGLCPAHGEQEMPPPRHLPYFFPKGGPALAETAELVLKRLLDDVGQDFGEELTGVDADGGWVVLQFRGIRRHGTDRNKDLEQET